MKILKHTKKTVEQITHSIILRQMQFGIDELEDYLTGDALKYAQEIYSQISETLLDQLGDTSKDTIKLLNYMVRLGSARINLDE